MKSQVVIEFGLTFFIIFTLLVLLIFITYDKINTIQQNNEKDYNMILCYQRSDYIINTFSTNPNELNVSAVRNFVESKGDFMTLKNVYGTISFGNYTMGNKFFVRRIVVVNHTLTFMDLVCNS